MYPVTGLFTISIGGFPFVMCKLKMRESVLETDLENKCTCT